MHANFICILNGIHSYDVYDELYTTKYLTHTHTLHKDPHTHATTLPQGLIYDL